MKKVIVISYYFHPSNFVGAQRTNYWSENLYKYGYYPIVFTRNWNENQSTTTEKLKNNESHVVATEKSEVHYMKYYSGFRDRLDRLGKLKVVQKGLSFWKLLLSNFELQDRNVRLFYNAVVKYIKSTPDVHAVIISGDPFNYFQIGYLLKRDFPHIHWIPDYRDEWTRNLNRLNDKGAKFFNKLEKQSEQKWTSNASVFITVSEYLKNQMSKYLPIKGQVVMNGIDSIQEKVTMQESNEDTLNLCYAGTVYPDQNFGPLLDAIKELYVDLTFVGGIPIGKAGPIKIVPKKSKKELEEYFNKIDLLIVTSYAELKSCLPVKLFDYFQTGKPILLCPSDNDVMEEFILKTNSGYVANTVEECRAILEELIAKKQGGESIALERNMEEAYFYSREYQTKKLAEILDAL